MRLLTLAPALLGLVALSACRREAAGGGGAAAEQPVATDHVDLPRSYLFRPTAITVKSGTRVTWTNHDVFTHAVLLDEAGAAALVMRPGDSVSLVLTAPGTHQYSCPFHPQMMRGTVQVSGS